MQPKTEDLCLMFGQTLMIMSFQLLQTLYYFTSKTVFWDCIIILKNKKLYTPASAFPESKRDKFYIEY